MEGEDVVGEPSVLVCHVQRRCGRGEMEREMEGGGEEGSGMTRRMGKVRGVCVDLIKSRGGVHHGGGRRESGGKEWGENLGDGWGVGGL